MTSVELSRGRRERFALLLSFACLVHCVGLVALAPLLPTVVALLAHDPLLEAVFWGSSATLSAFPAFGRSALGRRALLPWAWASMVAAGAAGLAGGRHELLIASLSGMAMLQIAALIARARAHRQRHT